MIYIAPISRIESKAPFYALLPKRFFPLRYRGSNCWGRGTLAI